VFEAKGYKKLKLFMFKNRTAAGKLLVEKLQNYDSKAILLAIPRGGVPVAVPIAKALHLTLALVLTKKIGHPQNKEFAIGAASLTDYFVTDEPGVSSQYIEAEVKKVRERLKIMKTIFQHDFTSLTIENKVVILVDDGMATGRTVLHTVHLLRKYKPKKIVLAVPVASSSAVDLLQDNIDELIVLNIASDFHAVGFYYEDFTEVTDSEVCRLLEDL
jgi:putative phosphoribosyl transferase